MNKFIDVINLIENIIIYYSIVKCSQIYSIKSNLYNKIYRVYLHKLDIKFKKKLKLKNILKFYKIYF
jgi:hypothetical protein